MAAAGVSETNYGGVYFEHPGQPAPLRNDGYHVDDPQLVLFGDNLDTDQDAIPDTVENSLGLNPLILNPDDSADGDLDRDRDGWSNSREFLVGTDLDDPADFLTIALQPHPEGLDLGLLGVSALADRLYLLVHSPDLKAWKVVDAVSRQEAQTFSLFQIPSSSGQDFFRVRVEWE